MRLCLRADRRGLLLTTGASLVAGGCAAAQVGLAAIVLNAVVKVDRGADVRSALPALFALALVTAVGSLLVVVQAQRQRVLGELVQRQTWDEILDVTGSLDLVAFEDPELYDHLQRIELNAAFRPAQLVQALTGLLAGAAGVIAVAAVLIVISPVLVPVIVLLGLPMLLLQQRAAHLEHRFSIQQTPAYRRRQYLRELLVRREAAAEVRAFGLSTDLRTRYGREYDRFVDGLRRVVAVRIVLAAAASALTATGVAATVLLLLFLMARGKVGLAEAGAAALGVRMLGTRVQQLVSGTGTLYECALFLDDLHRFIARRPVPAAAGTPLLREPSEIRLESGSFTYPRATRPALDRVDITLRRGEVVAVVGHNGSGKSTLAKVLAGLYQPGSGRLLWDGVDVRGLDTEAMRAHTSVVMQDAIRYALSATENIRLGRVDSTVGNPHAAALAAGAHDDLAALPDGYETVLSSVYGGVDLSGGQWQRISLARAFFRDAPLVVLDEPSSALDPRAEHALFARVRDLFAGRTVVLISHRFSTVRNADRILVMNGGRLVEQGTHDELMTQNGTYAELFTLQASLYGVDTVSGGAR